MFEFIKKKVRNMVAKKKAVKPKKIADNKVDITIADPFNKADIPVSNMSIGPSSPISNICIGIENKTFLTIEPDGKMIFNKNDFPAWKVDNFAREFVNIIEEITGSKS